MYEHRNTFIGPDGVKRRDQKAWPPCPHCSNDGMVLLDGDDSAAAPCPMCETGLLQELNWGKAAPGGGSIEQARTGFWQHLDEEARAGITWQGGRSFEHTEACMAPADHRNEHGPRCAVPARPGKQPRCDYHLAHPPIIEGRVVERRTQRFIEQAAGAEEREAAAKAAASARERMLAETAGKRPGRELRDSDLRRMKPATNL